LKIDTLFTRKNNLNKHSNIAFRSGHPQNPSALRPRRRPNPRRRAVAPSPKPPYHGRRDNRGGRSRDPAAATAVQASSAERAACGGAPRRAPPSAPRHRHGGDLRHRNAPGGLGPRPSPIQDRRKQTQLAPSSCFCGHSSSVLISVAVCVCLLRFSPGTARRWNWMG